MSHCEQETEFLRQMLNRDDSAERQHLESQLDESEQRLRCIRRACRFVALLLIASTAGVGYGLTFLPGILEHRPHFLLQFLYTVATGCLISLAIYSIDWLWQCHLANRLRERCRQFVLAREQNHPSEPPASESEWSLPSRMNGLMNFSRSLTPTGGESISHRAP